MIEAAKAGGAVGIGSPSFFRRLLAPVEGHFGLRRKAVEHREIRLAQLKIALGEELAGVGNWSLDVASGKVTWSPQVYRIHGLDPAAFDPCLADALAFYEDSSRDVVAGHISRTIATGEGFACKTRLVRPSDGAVRVVLSRGELMREEQTRALTVFGVFQDVTDQDVLLQQVSEDRERYKLLTQNATDVIAAYRSDATFTYLSPSIRILTGRTPEDLTGRKTYEIIHPDDHKRIALAFRALVESRAASARIEYRVLRVSGETVWVEAHPSPIYDARGVLTGFQDVVRDVSARRAAEVAAYEATERAEQALATARDSEVRYRLLAENANDMIAITSPVDSSILFVSPGSRRVLGYEPEELLGRKTLTLTHPDDVGHVVRFFSNLIAAGPSERPSPYRFRGLHKDGSWVWLEGQPRVQFDSAGAPVDFQDVVRDIHARKLAEDDARLAAERAEAASVAANGSERRYRLLAENATDMICKYTVDGLISFVSPASERIMGFTPAELIGKRTLDFIHPDDLEAVRKQFYDYVTSGVSGQPMNTKHRIIDKRGRIIWLEGRPSLIRSDIGEPLEYYDVMRDVTERVRLENDLTAARIAAEAAAEAKSEFLANMSHELRTPLTAVIGFADLAAEQPELSPRSQLYVERVRTAGRVLLSTVNDVLDFSKLEAGQVEICSWPTDPTELVQEVFDLVSGQAAEKRLRLGLEASINLPTLFELDPDRVRQVLTNLVGNAVKFTACGSVVVQVDYEDGRLRFAIRDTGPGIPSDRLDVLFQRFSQVDASNTRRHGGTGLGLAICKGLVQAMGGSITVQSRPGTGSIFHFQLPAAVARDSTTDREEGTVGVLQAGGQRLLLAEDNEVNRELVKALLGPYDLTITTVENGEQAVAAAAVARFDLILMDLHMPGIGGSEAAVNIRAGKGPNTSTTILAFTADVLRSEMDMFDGLIAKPVSSRDLLRALDLHLAGSAVPRLDPSHQGRHVAL